MNNFVLRIRVGTRGKKPNSCSLLWNFKPTFLLLVLLLLPTRLSAQDWPQFLGPTRNGVYSGTNIGTSWPTEGPPVRWQKKIGAGFSGPVVAKGRLILFHRVGDEETVECLNATDGKSLWTGSYPTRYRDDFGFDEGPRATPAVSAQRVFTFGAEGAFTCWNLADGKKQWSVATQKDFSAPKGFFGTACSPLVEGDLVLMNVGGSGGIVALDQATGKVRWKLPDQEPSYSSPVAATVRGERYAFFFTRQGLAVIKPDSGKLITEFAWSPPMQAAVNAATPLIVDDHVFLSTSYGRGAVVLKFDGKQLSKIWAADDVLSNHYATSVYHDGYLYGFDGRQEEGCTLRCVEFKTGKIKWSEAGFGAGTVTLVNGNLFILTERGELVRAPAAPNQFKATARAQILPFTVRAYPALADGRLYARSKDRFVCVDLR
jgi:outer membrane protein assembly factor BamB